MSSKTKSCDLTSKPKPAIGQFEIKIYPDGSVQIDLPRADCLKVLSAIADYEVVNNLCG